MAKVISRNQQGSSLATLLAMGVVGGLWVLSTAAFVVPSLGKLNKERMSDSLRCSAEAGLDWAVQQMNIPAQREILEAGPVSIPSSLLADNNGKYSLSGTVTVENQVPQQNQTYLYDPMCDPNNAASNILGGNGWRVVTARVQNASGSYSKTLRVILKPVYAASGEAGSWETVTGWGPPKAMFGYAMFAPGAVTASGNATTRDYDSSNPGAGFGNTKGSVGTNTSAALTGNARIGGDLNVFSNPKGSTTTTTASGSGNAAVLGNISSNGLTSGLTPAAGKTLKQSATNDQVTLPPTPSAPANSTNLGAINISGNNTVTISQPGNYTISSLKIAGNGKLNITASGKVNLYVQGASASIDIAGNGILNNSAIPGNLRVWYGGSSQVKITGNGNFTGVIYSPNANLKLAGNGELKGAVVGSSIDVSGNGTFTYDKSLANDTSLQYSEQITEQVWVPASDPPAGISYFQTVSWDER